MVNTIKFSQFAPATITDSSVTSVGTGTGQNVIKPIQYSWTTGTRPTPPYDGLLGYNTTLHNYEFYSTGLNAWVEVVGTPVITLPSKTIFSNITGSTAVAQGNSLTAILDAIMGSAQGNFLFRGASNWKVLAPGNSGQILSTGGAGADLLWIDDVFSGTVTSVGTGTGLTGGPITTSGTISLAPITTLTGLVNITGGSAVPTPTTLTAWIDAAIGSTQGDILYRDASSWVVLAPGTSGQFLQTGGAAANPAWASGNSGTVTNVATNNGLIGGPITTTGTIGLATIATLTGLVNTTGGTAVPISTTLTAWIDAAIGATQGDILYRNASSWVVLAPGTSGQFLQTAGAAANPTWASGNSGTVTSIAQGTGLTFSVSPITTTGTISLTIPVVVSSGGTGVTSVTTSPTASAFAGWDANKNLSANNFIEGYRTTATAAATTTLTVADTFLQFFTGSTTQTVVMPVTSTLVLGQSFRIVNNSSGALTINSSGGNNILTAGANTVTEITCILTSGTTAASWYYNLVDQNEGGGVTSVATGTGLTGGPITTTGTISLAAIADHTLLANTSGGSAAPISTTLTALIDNAIGSTQGNILYRNASSWVVLAPGTNGQFLTTGGTAANLSWTTGASSGFTTIVQQIFTSTGTYTPTANMKYCIIEVIGGGGGGGGANGGVAVAAAGGGGGGGGYSKGVFSAATIGVSKSVTIGAGGAAGTSAGGNGGTGGTTSVGSLIQATGGSGGTGQAVATNANSLSAGGAGGVGSLGSLNANGSYGADGFALIVVAAGGDGGSTTYGGGGSGSTNNNAGGTAGLVYGGGGGGAGNNQNNSFAGYAGAAGVVYITEFI